MSLLFGKRKKKAKASLMGERSSLTLAILLFLIPLWGMGQTPGLDNLDFNAWTQGEPDGWFLLGGSEHTANPLEGSSALHLETQEVVIGTNVDTFGLAILGSNAEGVPYTKVPASLDGWVRYDMRAGDTALIVAQTSRYDAQGDSTLTVSSAFRFYHGNQANWKKVSIPFQSQNPGSPDTLVISFTTTPNVGGREVGNHIIGSTMEFDAFSLTTLSGTKTMPGMKKYRIFPNPASRFVTIRALNHRASSVHLYDMTGKEVRSERIGQREFRMNLQGLREGIYLFQIRDRSGIILHTRKVSVVR